MLSANDTATISLSEPQGGTCLACSPPSGRLLSSPGTAFFEFTTSTTGYVTLPGESRKSMRKGVVAWPEAPSGLHGLWTFTYTLISSTTAIAVVDVVILNTNIPGTATTSGIAVDSTATNGCSYQTSGSNVGLVICIKLTSIGSLDKASTVTWWGDQMDGFWRTSTTGPVNVFTAKRLVSPNGDFVGIKRESIIRQAKIEAMRAAMLEAERLLSAKAK